MKAAEFGAAGDAEGLLRLLQRVLITTRSEDADRSAVGVEQATVLGTEAIHNAFRRTALGRIRYVRPARVERTPAAQASTTYRGRS